MPKPPAEWTLRPVRAPAKDLLTEAEVCVHLEIGKDALKELIAGRRFPGPVMVSPKTRRWKWEWILGYLLRLDMDRWMVEPGGESESTGSEVLGGIGAGSEVLGRKRRSSPEAG
jgi:hypothetical protein